MEAKLVWMNGKLVEWAKATVHFVNAGLHYGIGVFEGIRCYRTDRGPAIFRLREHIDRLLGSASIMGWRALPYGRDELLGACQETVAANGFDECYIRPVIYLAEGGWNLTIDSGKPHVGIAVWKWDPFLGETEQQGVRAHVSSYTRHHPNIMMTKAKVCGNYPNSVLAKTEAMRLGFDEAIMLDAQGYVAECAGENIFLVRGGRIVTPPDGAILEGITRDAVMALAREGGREVREQPVSRDQLYTADEVFLTGTAVEVAAVREIDGRVIGDGRTGPVTRELQQAFREVVRGNHPRSAAWLAYVR